MKIDNFDQTDYIDRNDFLLLMGAVISIDFLRLGLNLSEDIDAAGISTNTMEPINLSDNSYEIGKKLSDEITILIDILELQLPHNFDSRFILATIRMINDLLLPKLMHYNCPPQD